jgi:hypothetical protein
MNSLILALHLTAMATAGAADTQQQNNSWAAWFGCWQAEGAPAGELICISPTNTGARISTVVDGRVQDETNVTTDGLARRVRQQGCTGTERARWSRDRRRVFLDSDVACGASAPRKVRGMFAFVAPNEWISVQTASEGDSVATRMVRFVAANPTSPITGVASFTAGDNVSEDMLAVDETDVNEAADHLGAEAAQEWMREAGEPFQLGYKDDGQQRTGGSALDQVGRFSNPAPAVRIVERVVERPVYVHNHYYDDYYRWHYSPWGYRWHGWHWHRPVVLVRWPIIIVRNTHWHRDYYRYRTRWYDYDRRWTRNDHWRDRRDPDWRDRDRNWDRDRIRTDAGGRVTRDGYSQGRGRDRNEAATTQVERASGPTVERSSDRSGSVTRVRTATPRDRSTDSYDRVSLSGQRSRPSGSRDSGTSSSSSSSGRTARARSGGSR